MDDRSNRLKITVGPKQKKIISNQKSQVLGFTNHADKVLRGKIIESSLP